MPEDKQAREASREVNDMIERGRKITHDAAIKATDEMARAVAKLKDKDSKIEALKYHGLHMGISQEFMNKIAPKAEAMVDEINEIAGDDTQGDILTAMWLAKIFMNIEKLVQEEQE